MLNEQDGTLEIARNEFAMKMGCVPSQINYVITSRFTPQNGYIVESKRGGGGFIRIQKVKFDKNSYLMHFYNAIGDEIDYESSRVFILHLYKDGIIDETARDIMTSVLTENALSFASRELRGEIRAHLFKTMIIKLL